MASPQLERMIMNFALQRHRLKDGCSYISGAEYGNYKRVARSGDIQMHEFVPSLVKKLRPFGTIGEKKVKSTIGFCAETVSANRVLERFPNKIDHLCVGKAIRPKTMQFGKRCIICRRIF